MRSKERLVPVQNLLGVDLYSDPAAMDDRRFRKLRNYYPPRGSWRLLAKRPGSVKYNASAVTSVTRVDNIIRAWSADGVKKLIIAGNLAGNDLLYVGDDVAGTFAAITGGSGLPAAKRWSLLNWPLLGKMYAGSGDSTVPIQILATPFTTKADMTIAAGATDAKFGQHLTIFHQRLITARTPVNPNYIYYFDAGSDTTIGATQFWRIDEPVTALGKNTFGTQANSLREMLVAAGQNSLWFVAGDVSATIEQASRVIGCKSPKSMVNTPIGLMFLGSDRMMYLIRSDPREPERVGVKILPDMLMIPATQLPDVSAVYHNGFYKLSYAVSGSATNSLQYWADLLPIIQPTPGEAPTIEWYGPHDGVALLCQCVLDGSNDELELRGGDDTTGTVWKLDQAGTYADHSTAITGEIHTKEFTEGQAQRQKIWPGFFFGYLKENSGSVGVTVQLDSGGEQQSATLSWTQAGSLWDSALWDVDTWAGTLFVEDPVNLENRAVGYSMQLQLLHTTAADWKFRDFARKARIIPRVA